MPFLGIQVAAGRREFALEVLREDAEAEVVRAPEPPPATQAV